MKKLSMALETPLDDKPTLTVKESTQKLFEDIQHALGSMNSIWDAVELDDNSRPPRVIYAFGHVSGLLQEIVNAEKELIDTIKLDILSRRTEIVSLRKLLEMDPEFEEGCYTEGSIPLLKALEEEVKTLLGEKEVRTHQQIELYKNLQNLCRRAATNDDQRFNDVNEKFYSAAEMLNMRRCLSDLHDRVMKRLATVKELQDKSKKICETIGESHVPDADQELLKTDFSSSSKVLSEDVVECCKLINLRLREKHDAWMETLAERYDELLTERNELAKKCCVIPKPKPSAAIQSADLQMLDMDYQQLQKKYERGGPIFDKLNEWLSLWQERLNSEQRASRFSYYNTRGGSLNITLKRQKFLETRIPQLINELCKMSEEFAAEHGVEEILVDGVRPDKYATAIMEEYRRDKELQKIARREGPTVKTPVPTTQKASDSKKAPDSKTPVTTLTSTQKAPDSKTPVTTKAPNPKPALVKDNCRQ